MNYQLVLQWPASSIDDYDAMIEIEQFLIDSLSDGNEVDGHDAGSGEVNIFIRTSEPEETFKELHELLASRGLLTHVRAAFREIGTNEYRVLWPKGLNEFSVA